MKAALKREQVKAEIEKRGLHCVPFGQAWHIYGNGVDVLTADLANVDIIQLSPVSWALARHG